MSDITTQMREAGKILEEKLPGVFFTLIAYEISNPNTLNYVSTFSEVDHMIAALEDAAQKLRNARRVDNRANVINN